MNWYTAHIVMYLKFIEGSQDSFVAWENIVLFQAKTKEEAFEKAKAKGISEEDTSGTTTLNDRPVNVIFAGVRKLVAFEDTDSGPVDGLEVTYSEFKMESEDDFGKFIKGESAFVEYVD